MLATAVLIAVLGVDAHGAQRLSAQIAASAARFAPSWKVPGQPLHLQRLGALDWSAPYNLSRAQAAAMAYRDMIVQGYPLPDFETEDGMRHLMQAAALRAERQALIFIHQAGIGVPIEQAAARAEEAERLLLETGPYLSPRSAAVLAEARKNYLEAETRRKAAAAEDAVAAADKAWTSERSSEADAVIAEENGGYEGWLEPPSGFEGKPDAAAPLPESFEHAGSYDEIKALARERMNLGAAAYKEDWKGFEGYAAAAMTRLEKQVGGELKAIKREGYLGPAQRKEIESARGRVQELAQLIHSQAGPSESARVMAIRRAHALIERINFLEASLHRVEALARLKAAEAWKQAKNLAPLKDGRVFAPLQRVLDYYRGLLKRAGRAGDQAKAEAGEAILRAAEPLPPIDAAIALADAAGEEPANWKPLRRRGLLGLGLFAAGLVLLGIGEAAYPQAAKWVFAVPYVAFAGVGVTLLLRYMYLRDVTLKWLALLLQAVRADAWLATQREHLDGR